MRGVGLGTELEAWRQRVVWLRTQAVKAAAAAAAASSTAAAAGGKGSGGGGGGVGAQQQQLASLPDLSDAGLLAASGRWLAPHLRGVRSKGDMLKLPWGSIIR